MSAPWGEVLADIEEREVEAHSTDRPGPEVSRSIRRRRARRVAAVAAAAGCVLGASGWEAAHPPPPAPPVTQPQTLSAPVSLDVVNDRSLSAFGAVPECGSPAPSVRTSFGGIHIEPTLDEDISNFPDLQQYGGDVAQKVTADASAPVGTPVAAVMGAIYAKGGVVVGYSTTGADPVFGELGVDPLNPSVGVHVGSPFCSGSSVDLLHGLPVGEYQVFPVVRIHASPSVAAWRALLERESTVRPGQPLDAALAPGAPGCQSIAGDIAAGAAQDLPPECTGAVGVDLVGNAVSVRYPLTYYTGDLDLMLVGNPVKFDVQQTLDPRQTWASTPTDGIPWPANPQCGMRYTDKPPTEDTPVYLSIDLGATDTLTAGTLVSLEVGVRASRAPAAVAFPEPLDVWATTLYGSSRNLREILGHGTITLSAYDGAQLSTIESRTLVTGTVTSFEWCTGVKPPRPMRAAISGNVLLSDMSGTTVVHTVDVP